MHEKGVSGTPENPRFSDPAFFARADLVISCHDYSSPGAGMRVFNSFRPVLALLLAASAGGAGELPDIAAPPPAATREARNGFLYGAGWVAQIVGAGLMASAIRKDVYGSESVSQGAVLGGLSLVLGGQILLYVSRPPRAAQAGSARPGIPAQ
jgi:hypothetical protein